MLNNLYLRNVKLSGYKSIQSVDVEFQDGLNIVIGKNAAGKTNFLNFLNKTLKFDFRGLNNFNSILEFQNGKKISIESKGAMDKKDFFLNNDFNSNFESKLKIGRKVIKIEDHFSDLAERDILYNSTFICHGIPKNLPIIDSPLQFIVKKDETSDDLLNMYRNENLPYFIKNIILKLIFINFSFDKITESKIEKVIEKEFENLSFFSDMLRKYSSISEIRVSDNFNVFISDNKKEFTLNNFFIEFKIENRWLPFSSLSDGTKRLFNIISEIYDDSDFYKFGITFSTYITTEKEKLSRIILLEEPELGIHPHQFHKLMNFLKVQSETKQIILTTHSPQALDFLDSNELNRIVLAYSENSSNTKLRHLDEKELSKAKLYIENNFLSDYWLHSNLEN